MNLDKLKEVARRYELREEWRKAIDTYHRAIEDLAHAGEPADPSLHNRIGDLELKAGDTNAALTAYELAADTYADQGFYNNAIALCGKILRVNSGRTATFLRLAELHASKNVLAEARRNLLEFVERMSRAGQIKALADGVREFSSRFARSAELRHLIAEALRSVKGSPETTASLAALAEELGVAEDGRRPAGAPAGPRSEDRWSSGGLVFLDTGVDIPVPGPGGPPGRPGAPPPLAMEAEAPHQVESLPYIEPTAVGERAVPAEPPAVAGFEPTAYDLEETVPGGAPIALEAVQPDELEFPGLEVLPDFTEAASSALNLDLAELEAAEHVPLLDVELDHHAARAVPQGEPLFEGLDVEVEVPAAQGAGPGRTRDLSTLPQDELAGLFARLEEEGQWEQAFRALAEIQRREPHRIPWFQKRVELAYRSGDRIQLVGAYLALAQSLDQAGALENAALVYRRVIELDPGNPVATEALDTLPTAPETVPDTADPATEPAQASSPGDGFVDLGALILEPEPERDTRMRVDQGEPETEQDVDFRETLEQFKQGIEANLDAGDFQAHYDLGIAFKEMGLLDEAIAQFQKALRAPEGRLKSSEALGVAFHDKGRHAVAEAVLHRAVESLPGGDEEKIGLVYWLGRALEAQGRRDDALRCYQRVLAVDILFLDVSDRMNRLTSDQAP